MIWDRFPQPGAAGAATVDLSIGRDIQVSAAASPFPLSVDDALNGPGARSAFGVDGTGIKIGIVSSSFDEVNGGGNATLDELNGLLPPASRVHILQDGYSGGSMDDEGRALAQVVHSIAPGAEIYFYAAGNSRANMASAITALQQAGCQVIVDDIFFLNEPFYQAGDRISAAIDAAVAHGATYFTAAGNEGREFYESSFAPIAATLPIGTGGSTKNVTAHNFGTAANPSAFEALTLPVGAKIFIDLQWDQPFATIGAGRGSANSISFYLFHDTAAGPVLVASGAFNDLGSNPFQYVQYTNSQSDTQFHLAVVSDAGPLPGLFKVVLGSDKDGQGFDDPNAGTGSGSVMGHATDPNAIAVGAAPYYYPTVAEDFSAAGPGKFLFDANGNRLPSPLTAGKIDLVAPDGASTSVFKEFYGTSASAPAAAAVGALMLQANPSLNPSDVANLLKDSATAMSDPDVSGAGLVNARSAVGMAQSLTIGMTASHATVAGTHLDDVFVGGPGAHTIDGGAGRNTLDYSAAPGAIVVDIGGGRAHNGYGSDDVFVNVQNFKGTAFDDAFSAAAGVHQITGGGGHGRLQLHGAFALYALTNAGGKISVVDGVAGRDGTTNVSGVEFLQFGDKVVFVESAGISDVAALYSAALGRAPDLPGLTVWEDIYRNSVPGSAKDTPYDALAEAVPAGRYGSIAEGFTHSNEFQQKYGALSDTAFVTQLYQNVLSRVPDASGLNGWLDLMHTGDASGHLYSREMVLVGFATSHENYLKMTADWLQMA